MDDKIQLRMLGAFQIQNRPDLKLRRKNRALLAYLARASHPISRHDLANLFCQGAADPSHTLRLSLSRLRKILGEGALLASGEAVRLNPDYIETDATRFQSVLGDPNVDQISHATLANIVALYQGEFMERLYLPNAPEFEMWLVAQRSTFHQLYERGAFAWLASMIADEQYEAALLVAQKLVQHNPLLETAHAHLIRLYAQTAQRPAALAQFESCRTILKEELAVEPSQELLSLHADILAGHPISARTDPPSSLPADRLSALTGADFVGRHQEWRNLDENWQKAGGGQSRTLLISAPAGGGKTRLVQEWAKTISGAIYLYSACYESTRTIPYHPWTLILENLQSQLDPDALAGLPASVRQVLSRLMPHQTPAGSLQSSGQALQLFAAVHALLRLVPKPLVLFIDDWQWADRASLQLVAFLAERDAPAFLIGAYRPEEVEDNPALVTLLHDLTRSRACDTLTLPPLSPDTVAELIGRLWVGLPAGYREPHLRDQLIQATGGNPLFVNEIVRELSGAPRLPEKLPVPPSLRALIQRRLRQLPGSGRQVLEALAILGQPAGLDLVQQISGRSEGETLEALELGLRWRLLASLVDTPARVDFGHDLMGQAVLEQITPIRKQRLHRRAAAALVQQASPAAVLAYHWGRANEPSEEQRYSARAGDEAAAVYAYEEAIDYWQRALELSAEAPEQAALHQKMGQAWTVLGDWDRAEALFKTGLHMAGGEPSEVRAELQASYGLLLEYKGEYAAALEQEEPALAYFEAVNDRPQVARTLGLIALLHWRQARYDEALQICIRALADPEALTDPATHVRLLNISGLIYWRRQAYDAALESLNKAQALALQHGDRANEALVLTNLGNVVQELGQYDEAIAYYHQGLDIYKAMKNKLGISMSLGNLGLMYFYQGDDQRALDFGHRALEMDEALGNRESVARHLSNLANSFDRLERYGEALDYCRRALEIDAGIGNRRGALIHAGNMSSVYLLWGHPEEALACLAYALSEDPRGEHPRELARHLVQIAAVFLFQGHPDRAEDIFTLAMPLQIKLDLAFELSFAYWIQARVFLAQKQFAAAFVSLQKASENAKQSARADLELEAEILLPRAQVLAGESDPEAARLVLKNFFENQLTLRQKAAVLYEQWRLNPTPTLQERAREAYETLIRTLPFAEARVRANELGALDLPDPPAVPPLPPLITEISPMLEELLQKAEQQILQSPS